MIGTLLYVLLHVLLIGSMLTFVGCSIAVIFKTADGMERAIRVAAVFSGSLVVLGAQAAGLDFATFTVKALSGTRPGVQTAQLAAAAVPGALGVGLGYVLTRRFSYSRNIAVRIFAFIGMLAATQFATIYSTALDRDGLRLGPSVVPNIAFVVGIFLYIALTYDPGRPRRAAEAADRTNGAAQPRNWLGRISWGYDISLKGGDRHPAGEPQESQPQEQPQPQQSQSQSQEPNTPGSSR